MQAAMGRDLQLCSKFCERIVIQFKQNISQCKIAKNLDLSPSAVRNIVKKDLVNLKKSESMQGKAGSYC